MSCRVINPPSTSYFVYTNNNKLISKGYFVLPMWEEFLQIHVSKNQDLFDSSFYEYKVFKHSKFPVIGITRNQISVYMNWHTKITNSAKAMWPPYCGNKYWKLMHKFDPNNNYSVTYDIAEYDDIVGKSIDGDGTIPAVLYADTFWVSNPLLNSKGDTFFTFKVSQTFFKKIDVER